MFELPEFVTLARQINEVITGKVIKKGSLGNAPHKFVWYNRTPNKFGALTRGKTVGKASAKGKWLFVALEPGYVLVLGECGGKVLFHIFSSGRSCIPDIRSTTSTKPRGDSSTAQS